MAFNNSPELQIMQLYSLCILCKVVFSFMKKVPEPVRSQDDKRRRFVCRLSNPCGHDASKHSAAGRQQFL